MGEFTNKKCRRDAPTVSRGSERFGVSNKYIFPSKQEDETISSPTISIIRRSYKFFPECDPRIFVKGLKKLFFYSTVHSRAPYASVAPDCDL